MKTITFQGKTYDCPYYDLLPPLSAKERAELKADIKKNGVIYPVVIGDHLTGDRLVIIDGHHRLEIAVELGLISVPFCLSNVKLAERKKQAHDLNAHRRHLTPEQRKISAIALRKQGKSYREIAEELKVSPMTAQRDVERVTVTNDTVDLPERITGKDGKSRPAAARPKPTAKTRDEKQQEESTTKIKVKGVGIFRANEAIDCLKRIPKNDALRFRGLQTVMDFLEANHQDLWPELLRDYLPK